MIRFGFSGLPGDDVDDGDFLDSLLEKGHGAYELAFVKEFPWNERRCARFGEAAAERGIALGGEDMSYLHGEHNKYAVPIRVRTTGAEARDR